MLQTVPGATEAANTTFDGIRPTFPMLAANLANFGRIGVIYRKSIEQALVIFPALMAALITVGGGLPADEGGKLDFKVDLGDPPPCSTGFIPPPLIRSPADTTLRDLPTDLYCKTAQNDPAVVRGARNYPCQEFPGKRAPTVQLCRDPRGYVPIGTNPWRGPPIPYGTPMDQSEDNHYEPPGGTSRRPTSSRSSRREPTTTRARRPCSCRRACYPVQDPRRKRRSRCRCRRTTTARRPRGRTTRRPTRSCRRTAGSATRGASAATTRTAACRGSAPPRCAAAARRGCRRHRRPAARRPRRTIRGPVCSPTPRAGRASSPAVSNEVAAAETWVDLMMDPRQA